MKFDMKSDVILDTLKTACIENKNPPDVIAGMAISMDTNTNMEVQQLVTNLRYSLFPSSYI